MKKIIKEKIAEIKTKKASSNVVINLADEIAKLVVARLPRIPKKEIKNLPTENILENAYFLDTSAIVDGRILEFFKIGFISGQFVILDTVLMELKHIADAKDEARKARGRRALEELEKLKKIKNLKLTILTLTDEDLKKYKEVDEQIIKKAKVFRGKLLTCDYNLEKKAKVEGVATFNVYSFAEIFKIAAIPGDTLFVKIVHNGKNRKQGVGYLEDGTMIVIENAGDKIGRIEKILVSKVLQGEKGKIVFASFKED